MTQQQIDGLLTSSLVIGETPLTSKNGVHYFIKCTLVLTADELTMLINSKYVLKTHKDQLITVRDGNH